MSLHVIKLLDIYVCAKTALDLKHICVAQYFYSFPRCSLSYRISWKEVCLSATVQRGQNMKVLSVLCLSDSFVARMSGG